MPDSKVAIVAGGNGLIGNRIVNELIGRGIETYNIDRSNSDINLSLGDEGLVLGYILNEMAPWAKRFYYFVNAVYPKDWVEHARAFIDTTGTVAEFMKNNGGGSIINLSSIYGQTAADPKLYEGTEVKIAPLEYGFVKAGIIQMSKEAAVRYAPVRINVVCPGGVENGQDLNFVERYGLRTPLGRMAQPRDIAKPVCDILMWEYCTGQAITLDGGFTL